MCARIYFDDNTPGEHPIQSKFIEDATKILKVRFGIKVTFVRSPHTFESQFYTVKKQGGHIGDCYGFPFVIDAWCVSQLKEPAFAEARRRYKSQEVIEYVGIAYDEQERITNDPRKRYLLNELKLTEQDCFEICERHGLLSPKYKNSFRDGCWFCVKQPHSGLYDLWKNYPEYWDKLKRLQADSRLPFKPGQSIFDFDRRFRQGYVPRLKLRQRFKQLSMSFMDKRGTA